MSEEKIVIPIERRLKPCPFCGGHAEIKCDVLYRGYNARCQLCGVNTRNFETKDEAIEAWNRRAERKKGKWIYDTERVMRDGWINRQFHCSVCGDQEITLYNFCPHCGADMRGNNEKA